MKQSARLPIRKYDLQRYTFFLKYLFSPQKYHIRQAFSEARVTKWWHEAVSSGQRVLSMSS